MGIGPGSFDFITPRALRVINTADVLVGGKRQLGLFRDLKCRKIIFSKISDLKEALTSEGNIVVLASGDPGVYGILDLILRYKGEDEVEVVPGISSVQYIMAKLRLPMKDMSIVSLHGREGDLISKIMSSSMIVALTDDKHNPQYIAKELIRNNIFDVKVYVGENLSYARETITSFTVEELANISRKFDINVVVIKRCGNTE